MARFGLSLLLVILLCVDIESHNLSEEFYASVLTNEAKLVGISGEELFNNCTATYIKLVPVGKNDSILQDIISKFREKLRKRRSIHNLTNDPINCPFNLRKNCEREILILGEAAAELTSESNEFWKMAMEELLTFFDFVADLMCSGNAITDTKVGTKELVQAWNMVIIAYNKLSSKNKKELEITFCLRSIVKGPLDAWTTQIQNKMDKIAITDAAAGNNESPMKMEAISSYE